MATGSLQVNRDIILATKKQHLKQRMVYTPLDAVLALAQMQRRPRSILNYSNDGEGITLIAQITRHEIYDPVTSALHCLVNGADAIAFFTDHSIYDQDLDDMLMLARAVPEVAVLYQNYSLLEYEVMAARAADASGMFLYSSLLDQQQLRRNVIMAQRWKMSIIVQVASQEDLDYALTLSPHALAFGDDISSNLRASIEDMNDMRAQLPGYIKVFLMHTIHSLDDLALVLETQVDAVVVDEALLKHERTANEIRNMLQTAIKARSA